MKHFRLRPVLIGCLVSSFVLQFERGASAQELLLLPSAGLLLMGEDLEERGRGPANMWLHSPRRPSALLQRHFPGQHLAQDPPPPAQSRNTRPWYRHVSSTDNWKQGDFWYTDRDTLVGETAVDAWDPTRLINTDRPDFVDVATVVGDGVVQIETGYLQNRRRDDATRVVTASGPNALVRIGVGKDFEWRLQYRGFVRNTIDDLGTGNRGTVDGPSDLVLGFKWVMQEQADLVPMSTLVVRLGVPAGGDQISSRRVEPGFTYVYNWQIRRWWFLRGGTGFDWFRQPSFAVPGSVATNRDSWLEFSQAVSSYMQISQRVGMFAEYFAQKRFGSNDDHIDHFHDYGAYLYATPDLQFDARIGWRLGDHVDQAFWGAGVSMRF